jgi:Protein of unknown function (DUF3618).
MNINTEAQKDPAQLEREIDQQRAHIGDTISELEAQFSPGQMLDKVLSYGKTNGKEFSQNLVNTIRDNPVPTLLTALGVAWLMYGQNNRGFSAGYGYPSNASYGVDPDYEHHPSTAEDLKNKAVRTKEQIKGNLDEFGHKIGRTSAHWRHGASHAGHELRARAGQVGDTFSTLLREQPLAIGAIGIAAGALIAASLPATSTEDRYLGETRDKVAAKAKQKMQEGKRRIDVMGQAARDEPEAADTSYAPAYAQPRSDGNNPPKLHS